MSISAIADKILRLIEGERPGFSSHLNPGIDISSLHITHELRELYRWRNGTNVSGLTLGECSFFPPFYFLSLDDSKSLISSEIADPFATHSPFREESVFAGQGPFDGWFPFMNDGGGGKLFVPLSQNISNTVIYHWDYVEGVSAQFEGVESLLKTIEKCYLKKVFEITDITEATKLTAEIAAEFNPGCDYWNNVLSG